MKLIITLLLALSASAAPTITSVSPSSGTVAGGTAVTIKGSGFRICPLCNPPQPLQVYIGGLSAEATIVDANTLVAITPPNLPGAYDVRYEQDDGVAELRSAFTYTGKIEDGFERLLLPVFAGGVNGAHGSIFYTQLRAATTAHAAVPVWGLREQCVVSACIWPDEYTSPFLIGPGGEGGFEYTGLPGKFIYVPKSRKDVHFNLRVYDFSRSTENFGTEIRVAREDEFTDEPIKLLGVPLDPAFRNMVRIYAAEPTTVEVRLSNSDTVHYVDLRPGVNIFDPAYGAFGDFQMTGGRVDITVSEPQVQVLPITPPVKLWAFVSVTNNETQLITTITPQR